MTVVSPSQLRCKSTGLSEIASSQRTSLYRVQLFLTHLDSVQDFDYARMSQGPVLS